MKIFIYTIMKNEIDNIDSWLENIKDADGIYVLDTGSTDGSYEYMKSQQEKYPNLVVEQKIYEPFRFDTARNDNLAMLPEQEDEQIVCIVIDLDERLCDNWYQLLKQVIEDNPNFYSIKMYRGEVNTEESTVDNIIYNKVVVFGRCHQRKYAHWYRPVHETIDYGEHDSDYSGEPIIGDNNNIIISHFRNKKTNRYQYITLLEQYLSDNPNDIMQMRTLINEYKEQGYFNKAYELIMVQYIRALQTNCGYREIICGDIAEIIQKINPKLTEFWYRQAIALNPTLGTYYIALSNHLCYGTSNSRPLEAMQVLEDMENAGIVKQEDWREIRGLHTWLPSDTWGIAFSWIGNYVEAYNWFYKANELAKQNNDEYGCNITEGHMQFAKDRIR